MLIKDGIVEIEILNALHGGSNAEQARSREDMFTVVRGAYKKQCPADY